MNALTDLPAIDHDALPQVPPKFIRADGTEAEAPMTRTTAVATIEQAAIVEPIEDKLDAAIKAREQEIEAEKEAKRQAEAARVQKHRDGIATIRAYLTHAQQPGMTSERIARGIAALQQMPKIGAETFEEFADQAAAAYAETINAMHELHQRVLGQELEAQRVEAQRLENERRQRELDEQAAALRRQQDELAAAQAAAAAPAAPAATEGTGDTPAAGSGEAPPITQDAQEGVSPADAPACASSGAESADALPSGDEGPAAHADDSAAGSVTITAESAVAGAALVQKIASAPVVLSAPHPIVPQHVTITDVPPTLKLGVIVTRLGFGVTADFLRSIGFEPAATDKSAKLYHEADFPRICAAIAEHCLKVGGAA